MEIKEMLEDLENELQEAEDVIWECRYKISKLIDKLESKHERDE